MSCLSTKAFMKSPFAVAAQCLLISVIVVTLGCHLASPQASSFSILHPWRQQPQSTEPPTSYAPTFSSFVSPHFNPARTRRIVMIESGFNRGSYRESSKMIAELAAQFRSAGLFEVVTPANARTNLPIDSILQGRFNEQELARISRQFNADAVVLVRVNELRGFAPMRTSVTMAMVDSRETVVVYAADGNWDLSNATTQNAFKIHIGSQSQPVPGASQVLLQSPRALLGFVAVEIANNIRGAMRSN